MELGLRLAVAKVIAVEVGINPLGREDFVVEIDVVLEPGHWNVFHEAVQALADVLHVGNPCAVKVAGVQNLFDELGLHHDFGNARHARHGLHLLHEVAPGALVFFSAKVDELDDVHKGVEAQRLGAVGLGQNQRGDVFAREQDVLVGEALPAFRG